MAKTDILSMGNMSGHRDEPDGSESEDDYSPQYHRSSDASLDDFPMLGEISSSRKKKKNRRRRTSFESSSTATMDTGPISLSLVAASTILHRSKIIPKRSRSPSAFTKKAAAALIAPSPPLKSTKVRDPVVLTLLGSIPKDVLAKDILGFLTDRAVKVFLDCLGDRRKRTSCAELFRQFCPTHGSRLEEPNAYCIEPLPTEDNHDDVTTKCCPECYAETRNLKRCNGCKVFYLRYNRPAPDEDDDNGDTIHGFPGLRCQQCDRMAFCNVCLSDNSDGCGSTAAPSLASRLVATSLGGRATMRKLGNGYKQSFCQTGRITCHNYCCPNVFTNTMCGEFICDDCGDEKRRRLNANNNDDNPDSLPNGSIETCEECGKATCLDPNCLVCADFRLIHMSCKFVPDNAYKIGLGGILSWGGRGSKTESISSGSVDSIHDVTLHDDDDVAMNLTTKARRNLPDGVVWVFFLMALSKMWLFKKQQDELIGEL